MVRCFIGVMIPEELKGCIENIKDTLRKLPMNCKFVERENLHICFSFLGELEEVELENISKELELICNGFSRLKVVVDGIKMIPTEKYIRVLALDVIDKNNNLKKLMKEIEEKIGGSVKPSHLTLCRVKTISDKESTIEKIKSIKVGETVFTISTIQIIKSKLRKTGPIYTSIFEAILR